MSHLLYQLSYPRGYRTFQVRRPSVWRNTVLYDSRASRVSTSPDTKPSEGGWPIIEIALQSKRNDVAFSQT